MITDHNSSRYTSDEVASLALDTLMGRCILPRTGSFRTNDAGERLIGCSADALMVIEGIITTEVNSRLASDGKSFSSEHIGIDYLVGSYLLIGSRHEMSDRVFTFLGRQPNAVVEEAVRCASKFFLRTTEGYNFGVAPTVKLKEFLDRCALSHPSSLRKLAEEVRDELFCVAPKRSDSEWDLPY